MASFNFLGSLDQNPGLHGNRGLPLGYDGHQFSSVVLNPIFSSPTGNEAMQLILDKSKFQPDQTTDYGVSYTCVA